MKVLYLQKKRVSFFRLVKVNAYPLTLKIYCPYVPPP